MNPVLHPSVLQSLKPWLSFSQFPVYLHLLSLHATDTSLQGIGQSAAELHCCISTLTHSPEAVSQVVSDGQSEFFSQFFHCCMFSVQNPALLHR